MTQFWRENSHLSYPHRLAEVVDEILDNEVVEEDEDGIDLMEDMERYNCLSFSLATFPFSEFITL